MNTSLPNQPPNSPDPLAVTLAKLDPAPHGFDWNSLMFAAGRESKARALQFWRIVAGVFAVLACGFAFAYFATPSRSVPVAVPVERIIYVDRIAPAPAPPQEPTPEPLPVPQPTPESPPSRIEWEYETQVAPNAAYRWFTTRNEILTHGLGMLPDTGPKHAPVPRNER